MRILSRMSNCQSAGACVGLQTCEICTRPTWWANRQTSHRCTKNQVHHVWLAASLPKGGLQKQNCAFPEHPQLLALQILRLFGRSSCLEIDTVKEQQPTHMRTIVATGSMLVSRRINKRRIRSEYRHQIKSALPTSKVQTFA